MCTKITTFLFILNAFFYFGQCTVTVSTTADSGPGSFRQAILTANACASGTTPVINFTISANSFITLLSDLPSLTHGNTTVDGTTAPGFSYPNSMVTLVWQGIDDCIQIQSGNNIKIFGLAFTNNFNGNGDAAIRVNGGNNLLVKQCRAYKQDKNIVRVQGGNNVVVDLCTVQDFWYNNGDSQKAFEVNSGSLIRVSNCTITNVARKVFEINNTASGGAAGKISIFNNTFNQVGYGDSSVCSPTPCGMNKGEHVISSYTNHTAVFSVRNNTVNGTFSKFIEFINTNGTANNRDSVYNNTVVNCRGQHTLFIESTSGSTYGGIVIKNNTFEGDGLNSYNVDQVIEIGGWSNNYANAVVESNVIKNYHGRGIMFRFTDNTQILNNQIYNCSKDQGIELNNDCDNVTIQGNFIGTDINSTPGLAHFTNASIQFNHCDNCIIGGDATLGQGNVIVASVGRRAVDISSVCSGTTTIRGNKINTNASGTTTLSLSAEPGIHVNGTTAIIGGDSAIYRNIVSGGTGGTGIRVETSNATVQGNLIGCQANGSPIAMNNLAIGLKLDNNGALVGSLTNAANANKIGHCQRAIENNGQNNEWTRNEFWANTSTAVIDNSGGANGSIQAPVVSSVSLPYNVTGTGVAGARVELYYYNSTLSCQGYDYIGSTTVGSNGSWTFTASSPINQSLAVLQVSNQNASEFSCYTITSFPSEYPPVAAFSVSSNTSCVGECINLNDLSTNSPTSWQWSSTGGSLTGANNSAASICFSTPGTFSITLTVSNADGTDSETINVVVLPQPSIAGFDEVCAGSTQQLTVINNQNPAPGNPWSSLNGSIAQVSNSGLVTALSAGVATITFTSSAGCIGSFAILINPTFNSTQQVNICQGESYTVGNNVYSTSGIYTNNLYTALGCDSILVTQLTVYPSSQSNIYDTICEGETIQFGNNNYSQSGIYTDIVNNVWGCDSLITLTLYVEDCSGAGIFDSQSENVKIYPIPSRGEIFVEVPIAIVGNSWVIEDMTGREVMVGKFENKTMKFTLKDQSNGTYFIRIEGYGVERLLQIE